jgi:hypothetical protein
MGLGWALAPFLRRTDPEATTTLIPTRGLRTEQAQ